VGDIVVGCVGLATKGREGAHAAQEILWVQSQGLDSVFYHGRMEIPSIGHDCILLAISSKVWIGLAISSKVSVG